MITAVVSLAFFGLIPYSPLPNMDGYPDPSTTLNVDSDTNFSATLKSLDRDTFQDTTTQQLSQHPSTTHVIALCGEHGGLNSGSTVSMSGGYNAGVYTLNHTIHALYLSPNLAFYDVVDYYKSVDNNTVLLSKDADCHFSQSVRINNPHYEPPGCGGDGQS